MLRCLCAIIVAFAAATSLAASGERVPVRRDTLFPVEVKHTIKAATAKVGDLIEFRTDTAVLIGNNVVVPDNAVILGTVIEVRHRAPDSPHSLIKVKIHTLKWKDGEATLNAIVSSVRRPRAFVMGLNASHATTFLEGIRIVSHQRHDAFTELLSDDKDVSIRSGVSLILRQIDPDAYPDRDFNVLTPDNHRNPED